MKTDQTELYEYEFDQHDATDPYGRDQCPECGRVFTRYDLVLDAAGLLHRSFEAADPGKKIYHPKCWERRADRIKAKWDEYERRVLERL